MAYLTPPDVHYLAFEGGGGKGVTYLGAVEVLEKEFKLLPIKFNQTNAISGLAGSSAGAITALLLSLGYDFEALSKLLKQAEKFEAFFDLDPRCAYLRAVSDENRAVEYCTLGAGATQDRIERLVNERKAMIDLDKLIPAFMAIAGSITEPFGSVVGLSGGICIVGLLEGLRYLYAKAHADNPLVRALNHDLLGYFYNLLYDGGLFPGFSVRKFFENIIVQALFEKKYREVGGRGIPSLSATQRQAWAGINFRDLYAETRVKLVVTGANITQGGPAYFSVDLTPEFPVAEAVAISMNIPGVFKPILNNALVPASGTLASDRYKGLWVDGGLLNNLPIHAFDKESDNPRRSADPQLRPLHPNVLALRLNEGWRNNEENMANAEKTLGELGAIFGLLGKVWTTVLYPSEGGQLRTPAEAQQTIPLYTEGLSLLDFSPDEGKSQGPIADARAAVKAYLLGSHQ